MSLGRRVTLTLRTGPPGSGKTHSAVTYTVDEWIPNHDGKIFTNLPLNVDAIAKYCYPRDERKQQEVIDRIHLVPQEVEDTWLDEGANPADYFKKLEEQHRAEQAELDPDSGEAAKAESLFSGAMIMLDEAGKMWPSKDVDPKRKENVANVARWVSTLRHEGARLVLLCQNAEQLAPSLRLTRLAEVELTCVSCATNREPLFGAPLDHWLQLRAKLFGRYINVIREEEHIKGGKDKARQDHAYVRTLHPKYFPLYRSHNRRDGSTGKEEQQEWQRFGWPKFLWWLLTQNAVNLSIRAAIVCFFIVMTIPPFAGIQRIFSLAAHYLPSIIEKHMAAQIAGSFPQKSGVAGAAAPALGDTPTVRVQLNPAEREKLIDGANPVTMSEVLSELEQERSRRTELEAQLNPSIVLIDEQGVLTDEGDYVPLNSPIPYGVLANTSVANVNLRHDVVTLDDAHVLRMRKRPDTNAPNAQLASKNGAGTSRGSAGTAPPSPTPQSPRPANDVSRAGNSIR